MMRIYDVYVYKSVKQHWKVEAENKQDAEMFFESGKMTSEKTIEQEASAYEE